MARIFLFAIMILLPTFVSAQQDLNDPRYVYSLDAENKYSEATAHYLKKYPGEAVIYNGRLYKDAHYESFCYDSGLVYHDRTLYFSRRKIKQLTHERGIKRLYVIGNYDTARYLIANDPEFRKFLK